MAGSPGARHPVSRRRPCQDTRVPGSAARPSLLIVSFSPIHRDPRVLKQVVHFTRDFDVTTCGYGEAPPGVAEHIELPPSASNKLYGRTITARAYRMTYWRQDGVRLALAKLQGRRFDAAIANDIDALPVALRQQVRAGVLADMHEYFPRWREENPAWKRRIGPYYTWLCRTYLRRAAHITTVSGGLARAYSELVGTGVEVVTNATPFHDLVPGAVGDPIRLVHSGASLRRRHLERTVEAAAALPGHVELDLYLMPSDPAYHGELVELAEGTTNVRVHDPVPYAELVPTLNRYDVGVFVVPPVTFNLEWTLPNKLFDYVQARLAVAVGPSPEMATVVRRHGLGVVGEGFEVEEIQRLFGALRDEDVAAAKQAAHAAAGELAADAQVATWDRLIRGMVGR